MESSDKQFHFNDTNSFDGKMEEKPQSAQLVKPLTVDEALQFSPFSSIVPFAPDPIPVPTVKGSATTPLPADIYKTESTKSLLETLNNGIGKDNEHSPLVRKTIGDLQDLLKRSELTKIKFKPSFSSASSLPDRPKSKSSGGYFNGLGPFAKAMVKSTDLKLSYPSPTTPSTSAKLSQSNGNARSPQGPPKSVTPFKVEIKQPLQQPSLTNVIEPVAVSDVGTPATPIMALPRVVVPTPQSQSGTFKIQVSGSESPTSGKKRKRSEVEPTSGFSVVIDPKERSDVSVKILSDILLSIFEAEDSLQGDTSGLVSTESGTFFIGEGLAYNPNVPMLNSTTQSKLEKALATVVSEGRLGDIDIDDLLRLQKICQGALSEAETSVLRLPTDLNENDVDIWIRNLLVAEQGLRSSRILLRILSGSRQEKQLYSEETPNSILAVLKSVISDAIIPAVEMRSSGSSTDQFRTINKHKQSIFGLLTQSNRILQLLTIFLKKEEVSDTAINMIESLTTDLIFVENASSEKESILGIQKFERFRTLAMDVLANVFSNYPSQRDYIFDEVLTSLEKLPITRQSARQFKLADGSSIQLVSALIMKLVQTCATQSHQAFGPENQRSLKENGMRRDVDAADGTENDTDKENAKISEAYAYRHSHQAVQNMLDLSSELFEKAQKTAQHAVQFLVARAMRSTKTGDAPYRNLLDIFTEDFIAVVDWPDWPAAELLLRILLLQMIHLAEGDKTPAPLKNMSLDLMGMIGSAVSKILERAREAFRNAESSESTINLELSRLAESFLQDQATDQDLLSWAGPYRMSIECLAGSDFETLQTQSAVGYHVNQWATRLAEAFDNNDTAIENESLRKKVDGEYGGLAYKLRNIMLDHKWLKAESNFDTVHPAQGKLAYSLIIMNTPLCKGFHRVLRVLLNAMNSDQATVRSKSMKSLVTLLESDATILDRHTLVVSHISDRASDQSPLVRDSAVALLAKCMIIKPSLQEHVYRLLLSRAGDTAPGVRKRSMRLLKDIYTRTKVMQTKVSIAETLLHRVKDTDEGVAELARTIFEEMWMIPFYDEPNERSVRYTLHLREQISLVVKVLARADQLTRVFRALVRVLLSNASKTFSANFIVCKSMVTSLFEAAVDDSEATLAGHSQSRQEVLHTLAVFAEAQAKLFQPDQLRHIQPYLDNLSTSDDIHIYRSVLIIFRHVLPTLNESQITFMQEIQNSLLKTLTKLNKREQDELVRCLWVINKILKNIERLSRVTISCLKPLPALARFDFSDEKHKADMSRAKRYIIIAGLFGKHCDFDESQLGSFQAEFPKWRGNTVAGLMTDVFAPFTSPKHPPELRRAALDGLGSICQSWPKEYLKPTVCSAFDIVFSENNKELENFVLCGFKDFMTREEKRSESGAQVLEGTSDNQDSGRLSGAVIINQNDGVSTSIAQRYLSPILRIALSGQDSYALMAVELIASINRQGLVHPKECGPALVALETSTNSAIASIALREHRLLHQKHESIVEKEYQKAVQQAFDYQRDVVGDALGATRRPFTSKLRSLFEVLKLSKVKLRKKFLRNLCVKVDFEPAKLNTPEILAEHLQFARFIIENLAFFEYATVDELLFIINSMERVVKNTGTGVAHTIETEVNSIQPIIQSTESTESTLNGESVAEIQSIQPLTVGPDRLRSLTVQAIILLSLWQVRTFLRRLYGPSSGLKPRDDNSKVPVKELTKAPVKSTGVTADRFWDELSTTMDALESEESMLTICKQFLELLSIDNDFKVADESDQDGALLDRGDSDEDDDDDDDDEPIAAGQPGRGRKRKSGSRQPAGRPRKQAKNNGRRSRRGSANSFDSQ